MKKTNTVSQLNQKVIVITGGTTGLGYALLEQLMQEGCRLAICARSEDKLREVQKLFPEVLALSCDVSQPLEVEFFINQVQKKFGRIDVLINNAGVIMVGGLDNFTPKEFHQAMDVMYWGMVHTSLKVIPMMKGQGGGQIINITSVGGKVSIPKLLPYSAAKFAAVGFSEGITPELKKDHITVSTIVPGLMRTGSYLNALFPEKGRRIFKLFSFISSLPLLTVDADRAAASIIKVIKKKQTYKVVGVPARALIQLHHFFPETLNRIFSLTLKFLPDSENKSFVSGKKIKNQFDDTEVSLIQNFGKEAVEHYQLH